MNRQTSKDDLSSMLNHLQSSEKTRGSLNLFKPVSFRDDSHKLNSQLKLMTGDMYLESSAMAAISNSLQLASSVTGFEIVELWAEDENSNYYCTYAHVSDSMILRYPHLISGHHPKLQHKLSPKLCKLALESSAGYYWKATKEIIDEVYNLLKVPFQTEFAYHLEGLPAHLSVFIVGLSVRQIPFKQGSIKFLSGLGFAIYAALFENEPPSSNDDASPDLQSSNSIADISDKELDNKLFDPICMITPHPSSLNLAELNQAFSKSVKLSSGEMVSDTALSPLTFDNHLRYLAQSAKINNSGLPLLPTTSDPNLIVNTAVSPITDDESKLHDHLDMLPIESNASAAAAAITGPGSEAVTAVAAAAPSWNPVYAFSYPVSSIPVKVNCSDNLPLSSFLEITHLADGSNANVFTALYNGNKVIIKMIKAKVDNKELALHEFELEHGMLSRLAHQNIIRLLGAGTSPRKFMVLEYLEGGSLNEVLQKNKTKHGMSALLFHKPTFPYLKLLQLAKALADVLDYLHMKAHPGACMIHRDLKPDNVGFTADGCLKLFDFGLVTCVKSRQSIHDSYKMTGYTGSLRYMAPEVALREPYTEKVDVYSFGIMLWQMAKDKVPFTGMGKKAFIENVVVGGLRPKLDKSWPSGFCRLLTSCWQRDPSSRPSFAMIVLDLDRLIDDELKAHPPKSAPRGRSITGGGDKVPSMSSWF